MGMGTSLGPIFVAASVSIAFYVGLYFALRPHKSKTLDATEQNYVEVQAGMTIIS
jgi:hypothetical protein